MTELIGLPKVLPYEAPSSWLTRAALSQGAQIRELLAYLNISGYDDPDLAFLSDALPEIRNLCGLHPQSFEIAKHLIDSIQMSTIKSSRLLLPAKGGKAAYRVCPLCMDQLQTPYLPIHCRFTVWRYCPDHECLLEDSCWSCQSPIRLPESPFSPRLVSREIAYLSQCFECGWSHGKTPAVTLASSDSIILSADRLWLMHGRATLAALLHRRVAFESGGDHPLHKLGQLERMGLLPTSPSAPTARWWREHLGLPVSKPPAVVVSSEETSDPPSIQKASLIMSSASEHKRPLMFVASTSFENPNMSTLANANGDRYFRAVNLSDRLPWFIVTSLQHDQGLETLHSICCAWDGDLLSHLEPTTRRTVVSLQRLAPSSKHVGGWEVRNVACVWKAVDTAGNQAAILQDTEGRELPDAFGESWEQRGVNRTLVFQAGRVENERPWVRNSKPPSPALQFNLPLYTGTHDPYATVSATELATHLGGIDAAEVSRLEADGQLLSSVEDMPSRAGYPLYQALPGIAGARFAELLSILRNTESPSEHEFFKSESPELGLMTPVEALIGGVLKQRGFREEAAVILATNLDTRHEWVKAAARTFVASTSGW